MYGHYSMCILYVHTCMAIVKVHVYTYVIRNVTLA